jgi:hypothetical protein
MLRVRCARGMMWRSFDGRRYRCIVKRLLKNESVCDINGRQEGRMDAFHAIAASFVARCNKPAVESCMDIVLDYKPPLITHTNRLDLFQQVRIWGLDKVCVATLSGRVNAKHGPMFLGKCGSSTTPTVHSTRYRRSGRTEPNMLHLKINFIRNTYGYNSNVRHEQFHMSVCRFAIIER